MGIKETIQKKARQIAKEYKEEYVRALKEKYLKVIENYEDLLTKYYKLEVKINFLTAMENGMPSYIENNEIQSLKQEHVVLLKAIKDIENAGILDEYDAVEAAIKQKGPIKIM